MTPNSTNVHVGSFAFTASSASGVQINTVSIKPYPNGSVSTDIQNLKLIIAGTQFGTTQGVVADAGTYTFSGSPFTVPAGGTTYVDVYADVLSSAASSTGGAASLTACSGTGVVSYNAISCSGSVTGQNLTIAGGGTTMSVGLDSSAPASAQLVMGSTGNTLAAYRFAETQNIENVKITDLTIAQNSTSSKADFQNVAIYNGSTLLGTAGSASSTGLPGAATGIVTIGSNDTATTTATSTLTIVVDGFPVSVTVSAASTTDQAAIALAAASYPTGISAAATNNTVVLTSSNYNTLSITTATVGGLAITKNVALFGAQGGYTYSFHFGTPVIVPQANSVTLTLKGDVASYNSLGSTDNTTSTFSVVSATALGASSNLTTTLSGGAVGNTMTVLRTVVTPSATALGNTTNRTKSAVDNLATLTFTANSAGSAMLKTLVLNFTGNAVSSSFAAPSSTVTLLDANNNDVTVSDNASVATSSCGTLGACTMTWTFSTTTTPFVVSGGSSYSFTLRVNDTSALQSGSSNNSVTLGVTIPATTTTAYYDAGQVSGANAVAYPFTITPLNVISATFAPGS